MDITTFYLGLSVFLLKTAFGLEQDLFPVNQEFTFLWNALITSGSSYPEQISSEWNLSANLIIQTTGNYTIFQLKDVKNDGEDMDQSALLLPFRAVYKCGNVVGLETENEDTPWSVNMKRALLNLIQLNINLVTSNDKAFISDELGLYGYCKVEYIVQPTSSNTKHVKKILDLSTCQNYQPDVWSSSPKFMCPNSYQNDVVSHSEREYFINTDSQVMIQNISARGIILFQPYQSRAEAHHSVARQTLILKSVSPIEARITLSDTLIPVDMFYKEIVLDATHGLPPSNKTIVLEEIEDMLEELSNSLWWDVGSKGLNNETVFHLINLMWWLELEDWELLYETVTLGTSYKVETMQNLFWELVPEVGSFESALFIRDLVKTKRVKGILAGRLLVNFPFFQRKPTEDLLIECEGFLHFSHGIEKDVRHSAILSFASLVHKTCTQECKADTVDRYAKLYLDRFTECKEYEERMLYLQGLSNMDLNQILDYLAPVITGQASTDHHIQFLASWAVLNSVYTNPNKVFELFWPLLNNRSQKLEIRVAAMTMVILSKPAPDRFLSLFWYMQSEPSLQLCNFYYTTIKSLASTAYPCYSHIGVIASQLSRSVKKKSSTWATGNYLLDYEDKERGYGGLLQLLLIASERTGLPNIFIFMTEQHSLGVSTSYALYIKAEGVGDGIKQKLHKMSVDDKNVNFMKIAQLLKTLKVSVKHQEEVHLEFIFKVNGKTVITQYLNSSSFHNISSVLMKMGSIYFEFSVNYQRLSFPLFLTKNLPTDIGLPLLVQIRSSTIVSARGSVSQDDGGKGRNAELDLRYSWNGISALQVYSPLSNKWYGVTRSRSLHIRLPFAVQLHFDVPNQYYKVKTIQHRDYIAGSRLGVVWHTVTKLISKSSSADLSHSVKEEWTMDSLDLGARLGASVFDCPRISTISEALLVMKKAFTTHGKNYQMVPCGAALLGVFSLSEQLSFQPPGGNCGVMLSFTPLLSQVEPLLTLEKNQLKLQMSDKDGVLWEIQAGSKKRSAGSTELTFKLYHTPSVRATPADIWRVMQFEGAFVLPSNKAGVFSSPAPLTGYTFVSWGDSSPTRADKTAVVDIKVDAARSENDTLDCPDLSPKCLQSVSEMATHQVASVQFANLPGWLLTAAHALFPEHIRTESSSTNIEFSSPASLPPWRTKGLCAVNTKEVLTTDNITRSISLTTCFTVLVADCSLDTSFVVLVKKMSHPHYLAVKLHAGNDIIELLPTSNGSIHVFINESKKLDLVAENYEHSGNMSMPPFSISMLKSGALEVELGNGVVVQHFTRTIVALVPGVYRGYTCGLCADFNGDTNTEPVTYYSQC